MVCWSPETPAPAPVLDALGLGEEEESFMSMSSFLCFDTAWRSWQPAARWRQ